MKTPKAPEEDPEVRARREMAERRAEAGRISELSENVGDTTQSFIRKFGRLAGVAAPPFSVGGSAGGAYSGTGYSGPSYSGGGGGSGNRSIFGGGRINEY